MSNQSVLEGVYQSLERVVEEYLEALDGIPDQDLATWKPAAEQQGGGEMNTLSGMSVHTSTVARWIIEHQVFGLDFPRDREFEFTAKVSQAEIVEMFDNMLRKFEGLIESDPNVNLAGPPSTVREYAPDWTKLAWLLHALDHTALHLGHAQVTRQLWLAERGNV